MTARIDHVGYAVSDIGRSRGFYEAALAPLDIRVVAVIPPSQTESGGTAVLFGVDEPFFIIADEECVGQGTHIAFTADRRDQVDAFHAAALGAGGRDHGGPGLRPQYHRNYYAAFVHDPDGYNVEVVCHLPE